MKRLFSGILPIFIIVAFGAASLAFNYTVVDVRLDDLGHLLGNAAKAQDENRSLGILARYELIRRRMKRGHENTGDYELESRVQAVVSNDWDTEEEATVRQRLLKSPARILLNMIRVFLGKQVRTFEKESSEFERQIEYGYFFERNRHYDKAVGVYRKLLKRPDLTDNYRRYLVLHEGFCLSLTSKYGEAKKSYEEVISRYPNSEAAVVAWKLIDFLENIEKELKVVHRAGMGGFDKARKLYLLMDYRGAIKEFSKLLGKRKKGRNVLEMRFLKGRAHEELGENKEAMREYKEILSKAPKSKWGREANRRIYILGEFYEKDKEMTEMAMNRIEQYRDGSFFGKLKGYSDIAQESEEDRKIRKIAEMTKKNPGKSVMSQGELEKLLAGIDLTGEEEDERQRRREDKEDSLKDSQKKEQMLAALDDPPRVDHRFRKPMILKRTIDRNVDDLKYIYNRHLRRGKPFQGEIKANFGILPSGKVSYVKILKSTTRNPKFDRQIADKIKTWRFLRVPKKVGLIKMTYPFRFEKDE